MEDECCRMSTKGMEILSKHVIANQIVTQCCLEIWKAKCFCNDVHKSTDGIFHIEMNCHWDRCDKCVRRRGRYITVHSNMEVIGWLALWSPDVIQDITDILLGLNIVVASFRVWVQVWIWIWISWKTVISFGWWFNQTESNCSVELPAFLCTIEVVADLWIVVLIVCPQCGVFNNFNMHMLHCICRPL